MTKKLSESFLTGQDSRPIVRDLHFACPMHRDVVAAFRRLQQIAADAGQCLQIASGYRDFARQLLIWNEKVSGKRPLLDQAGEVILANDMSEWELIQYILRWSALPGASRHHWGTDFDVYNPDCLPENYQLQLTREEYEQGALKSFNRWLSAAIDSPDGDFFRPYQRSDVGVAPEPWHISYRPLANQFQQQLTIEMLASTITKADLLLKDCVLQHLDEIFHRFVRNNRCVE